MANWLTYRIKVGDDVLVLGDEAAQELIKNETERSKKADAQTASFLESTTTNGIIRNSKSDPFGQTAIGGMKVVIDKGDLIINGNIKNHARLTRTYNVTQENRTEVFLYRYDSVTNEITGLWRDCIIQGDIILSREDKTELPLRSSGYYDILICKITIPAGATEITQDMIGDFRQNEYYCGYAKNLLVEIDDTLTKSDAAADAAAVGTVISDLRKETRTRDIITEKRITNLEAGLPAERWSVDDSVAYIKEVPENALPFASVDMVGGITRKCTNLLDESIITDGSNWQYAQIKALPNTTYTAVGNVPVKEGLGIFVGHSSFQASGADNQLYSNIARTFTTNADGIIKLQWIIRDANYTFSSYNFMLNSGTEPLPYEPYFDGLRSAPVTEVKSMSANLVYQTKDVMEHNGVTFTKNADGSITMNGTSTAQAYNSISGAVALANGTYTLGVDGSSRDAFAYIAFNDGTGATVSIGNRLTFTITDLKKISYLILNTNAGRTFSNDTYYVMVNRGSTALPYTPYREPVSLHIPAAVQALDGYGWGINDKVYNYVDLEKKQFVKWVERVDMGTLGWRLNEGALGRTYRGVVSNMRFDFSVDNRLNGFVCSAYNPSSVNSTARMDNKSIMRVNDLLTSAEAFVRDDDYTDAATFKAAMSGVMLYYELAEPIITDISDLLPDDNLIRVEGGGTVTMVNEYGYDVPSEITYQLKGAEA